MQRHKMTTTIVIRILSGAAFLLALFLLLPLAALPVAAAGEYTTQQDPGGDAGSSHSEASNGDATGENASGAGASSTSTTGLPAHTDASQQAENGKPALRLVGLFLFFLLALLSLLAYYLWRKWCGDKT